jgi:PhzF family phenazine biosynthesis protein
MGRSLRIFRVDAFSEQPFAGNPAAVVPDAEELGAAEMQSIARELGVDTACVLPPEDTDHELRVRFFTPRAEAGLIGHATLAVHAVLDFLGRAPSPRQKQRGGIVEVERIDGATSRRYAFSQAPPPIPGPLAAGMLAPLLGALGLRADELDPGLPVVLAGSGGTRALIGIRSGATLARLRPDLPALAALSANGGPAGFFVYTLSPAVPDCDTEARMFCPAIGIAEDPVSGNAHAMLASHLHSADRWPASACEREFTGRQGHHIGRPGTLVVSAEPGAAGLSRVRVAGSATIVMDAQLELA